MKQDNYKDAGGEPVSNALIGAVTELEAENALRQAADKIIALNKTSGAHAFDLGCGFAEAKPLVPEKGFGKWLATFSDYTVRSAWNYISIHERLANYREQLLAHAVMPTVMFELAKGEPAQIEAAIAKMADGERIRVKDVREMFGRKPKAKGELATFDTAGLAGLRKVAAAKTDADAAQLQKMLEIVLNQVELALEPLANKKPVVKKPLQDKVVLPCRHAHDVLNSIGAPLQPDATSYMNWRAAKLPEGTVWRKVQDLLHRMGGADDWAKGRAFVPWLQNEVVPLLRFVVHGEAVAGGETGVTGEHTVNDTDEAEGLVALKQVLEPIIETVEEGLEPTVPERKGWLASRNQFALNSARRRAA